MKTDKDVRANPPMKTTKKMRAKYFVKPIQDVRAT